MYKKPNDNRMINTETNIVDVRNRIRDYKFNSLTIKCNIMNQMKSGWQMRLLKP